ncbi:MAG: hypothetical protein QMC81_01125 [Thermoanaerobacterales bacterium]|nr:hypothetical protein [Bacillota bacterium]MDI6906074.1 hypothetical protein [Thermoanaerobacterales bacterium]
MRRNPTVETNTNGNGKHLLSLLLLGGGTVVVYALIFLDFQWIKPWLTRGFYAACITMPTVLLVAFLYGGVVYRLLKPLETRIDALGIGTERGHH